MRAISQLIWNALRSVACATRPHTDAKRIIQLDERTVIKAVAQSTELNDFDNAVRNWIANQSQQTTEVLHESIRNLYGLDE